MSLLMRLIMIRCYSFCLVLPVRDISTMRFLMPRPWELNPLFQWTRIELLTEQLLTDHQSEESLVFALQEKRNGPAITAINEVM